jgi:hypothetical protein
VEAAQYFFGTCLIEVNRKRYLEGPCEIAIANDGGFSIGASETKPISYFAIVSVTAKDVGEGYWNQDKGANHAHTPLGRLVRKGACWQNQRVKVCAWK